MSVSDSGDVFEERPSAEGQEDDVPSKATMRTQPTEPPTVPPEPCLEPRPPVDGAPDITESTPQSKKINPGQKKVTPEQQEEIKLKSKYGKLNKPGGSDFLRMRLNKGGQKYFDSGDYNMAKSKGKIGLRIAPKASKPGLPRPIEATTGDTIPTPDAIHLRKTSVQGISNLAV